MQHINTLGGVNHAFLHILFLFITYQTSHHYDAADGADSETRNGGRGLRPSEAQDGLEETPRVSAFGLC